MTSHHCNGDLSTVTVSASGGVGPYDGTGTFSHAAGSYSYTVTDHNGCIKTTSGTITEPSAVVASSSNTAIQCNGDNSTVTVSASGGVGPYDGTGTFSHAAGSYSRSEERRVGNDKTTRCTTNEQSEVVAKT